MEPIVAEPVDPDPRILNLARGSRTDGEVTRRPESRGDGLGGRRSFDQQFSMVRFIREQQAISQSSRGERRDGPPVPDDQRGAELKLLRLDRAPGAAVQRRIILHAESQASSRVSS
jgi:hypothetical protein